MPISALPSPYGIGTLGKEACRFIDFLEKAGQSYWQIRQRGRRAMATRHTSRSRPLPEIRISLTWIC